MFIECLIERSDDSDTFVDFEQVRYRFRKNQAGDRVCFVGSDSHRRRLLGMGEDTYREYHPPSDLQGPIGATAEPMTRQILRKKSQEAKKKDERDALEALTAQPDEPVLVDFDWSLDEKVAKTKEFKFLGEDKFRSYVDENRESVMQWPIDVRRELAKKLENLMPEEDPDIEGFIIDDYLRSGSTGDT